MEAKKSPSGVAPEGQKSDGRLEPSRRVGNDGCYNNGDDRANDHESVGAARGIRRAKVHVKARRKSDGKTAVKAAISVGLRLWPAPLFSGFCALVSDPDSP